MARSEQGESDGVGDLSSHVELDLVTATKRAQDLLRELKHFNLVPPNARANTHLILAADEAVRAGLHESDEGISMFLPERSKRLRVWMRHIHNLHAMPFAVLVGGFPLRIVLIVGNLSASKRFSLTFDIF